MFVILTSFTTYIHEATSQKETDISNWLTVNGKTAVDRIITGADVISWCCCLFVNLKKRLQDLIFTLQYLNGVFVWQYRKGGVLVHCYQNKVNLYFHVKLTVISFSFDCNYYLFGTMFLMLFWTRVGNKLPWVPEAFHARFPVSCKSF